MRAQLAVLACVACTGGGAGPGSFETSQSGALTIGTAPPIAANILYDHDGADLISNGDFEDYADRNVPAGWSVDEIYGYRGMFSAVDGWRGMGVRFVRNA